MSGGADVLAVLLPEVRAREDAAAALPAEAARLAAALGGSATAVELVSADRSSDEEEDVRFDAAEAAAALVDYVRSARPRAVLFFDGDAAREIAPRLARAFDSSAILGCAGVSVAAPAVVYSKPVYGGWLEQELSYADGALEVATLAEGAVSAAPAGAPALPVGRLEARPTAGAPAVSRLELRPPDYRTVDLVYAERIVAVGMGAVGLETGGGGADESAGPAAAAVATAESTRRAPEPVPAADGLLGHVRRLAELLNASVAATRPVVDDGHLPKERLVGQTGKTVAPGMYLTLGISGSPHHVAGIQQAGTILAVDRDAAAPIFQFADAGYVADLREVLPALVRRIEEWRDGGD